VALAATRANSDGQASIVNQETARGHGRLREIQVSQLRTRYQIVADQQDLVAVDVRALKDKPRKFVDWFTYMSSDLNAQARVPARESVLRFLAVPIGGRQ
jgi:hypothetical protein